MRWDRLKKWLTPEPRIEYRGGAAPRNAPPKPEPLPHGTLPRPSKKKPGLILPRERPNNPVPPPNPPPKDRP